MERGRDRPDSGAIAAPLRMARPPRAGGFDTKHRDRAGIVSSDVAIPSGYRIASGVQISGGSTLSVRADRRRAQGMWAARSACRRLTFGRGAIGHTKLASRKPERSATPRREPSNGPRAATIGETGSGRATRTRHDGAHCPTRASRAGCGCCRPPSDSTATGRRSAHLVSKRGAPASSRGEARRTAAPTSSTSQHFVSKMLIHPGYIWN